MAARLNPRHQEMVRAKIQASHLINGLHDHFDGKRELTATQLQSAKILLDKSISNAATILAGPGDAGEHKLDITLAFK
jgi:hypothetical protein